MPNDNPNGGCAQVIGYMSGLNRYAAIDAMAGKSDNPANLRAASNGRARVASCRGRTSTLRQQQHTRIQWHNLQ